MDLTIDFSDKSILVVGGSSGIGNGIAQAFKDKDAKVRVWGTRPSAAHYDGVDGSDLTGLDYAQVDVSDPIAIDNATAPGDQLDALILCQGVVEYNRAEFERDGWDRVMAVNLDSVMDCARKFKEQLAAAKGSIIIVSSVSGMNGNIGNPAYAASKAGAVSLTKSLAMAWAREGIRVNGIAPGLVDTKLTKVTTDNPKRLEAALRSIPMGCAGEPSDMAGVALFLASPLARYVCGHTIVADGGLTL